MKTTERTDTELLLAMIEGDTKAFESLYHRHKDAIFGYCFRMLRDRALTEDAVQETFIRVHRSNGTLKDPSAFLPWMYRIARNQVLMALRGKAMEDIESADSVWSNDDPHASAIAHEQADLLQRHLDALRPEYREALILREYQQLSYAEIATATSSTESAVKSRIFKARRALAERLRFIEC